MAQIERWTITEPWLHPHCLLGEGPFFEPATNSLRFVDIKKKHLHTVSLADPTSLKTLEFPVRVTVTADIEGVDPAEKILVGTKYGLAILNRKTGALDYIAKFGENGNDNERIRSNDGGVDPNGRFWVGTMTDFGLGDFQPEGSVFTIQTENAAVSRSVFKSGLTIPNTIGFSPAGDRMYITHSSHRTIFAYPYDRTASPPVDLTNESVFYSHDGPGEPDGYRVDTDGNLWHAVYGEGKVLKLSPEGKLLGEVSLPTANITCVEFCGTELFITSAADDKGTFGPKSKEYGGAIFRVNVAAEATPRYNYKMQ